MTMRFFTVSVIVITHGSRDVVKGQDGQVGAAAVRNRIRRIYIHIHTYTRMYVFEYAEMATSARVTLT